MRIAFDATAMPARRAGAGVYMYELARALAEHGGEHPLLLLERWGALADLAEMPGMTVRQVRASGRARRLAWEQSRMPLLVRDWSADVLHGPHHALPLLPAAPAAVATVHDITFDMMPRRYTPARRWYMRAITRLGLLRADRVIVPSAFVRDAVVRRYRVDRAKVHVIAEAAPAGLHRVEDAAFLAEVRARHYLPGRFLLSVGTLEPGKNRRTLLRALSELRRRGHPHALVVVGQRGWLEDDSDAAVEGVHFTGYVPSHDLAALYTMAEVMLFPSWLEGFGLPPLEALACGTPVVSSHRPAMPEVLGDAVLYADPRRPVEWADAIERLLDDRSLRERMIERGSERAARYSWQRAAKGTVSVYRAALGMLES